jgi:two-component system response regulator RegA
MTDNAQPLSPGSPRTFLLVDDDAAFRTRLVKALESRGLKAFQASNGADALELAAVEKPEAAIVDMRMPGGMSGLDVVQRLAERHPDMEIVVLTGYGSIATAVEAVRLGAINYLQKPLDTEQILSAFDTESDAATQPNADTPSLARVEWEHIQRVLADCEGNISLAARRLGLHRRSLQRKLGKLPPLE